MVKNTESKKPKLKSALKGSNKTPKEQPKKVSKVVKTEGNKKHDDDKTELIPIEPILRPEPKTITPVSKLMEPVFRIITASYEHVMLCLSLSLYSDASVFTPVFHFSPHIQSIRCLAQSKRYLVSGSNDENIRLYDLQKRKELGTLMQHEGNVTVLEFFDNKWLLSAGDDGRICIWRTKDWEVMGELKGHKTGGITDMSIHPSGKIAISAGGDRTLRLWNLMTCKKASVMKVGREGVPRKVKWTSQELDKAAHYVVGFDKKVWVYSAETATQVGRPLTFRSTLQHLDIFVLDNVEYVVTSHDNGTINFVPLSEFLKETEEDEEDSDDEKKAEEFSIENLPESAFKLQGHASRVKHFSFFYSKDRSTHYMTSVSSSGGIVVWNLEKSVRDQVAVYETGNRLNCCIMVPEDVERFETMKKRKRINADGDFLSEAEDTDFSEVESDFESEAEESTPVRPRPSLENGTKKNKQRKSKKTKVTVEFE